MWFYGFLPVVVAVFGSAWTTLWPPGVKVVGAVQHFAAGVIFFAAAAELLPSVLQGGGVWPVVIGGAAGIALMLALQRWDAVSRRPAALMGSLAVDALIDGLVLGLGFHAGKRQGIMLAIALAVEFLFLGLSVAPALGERASSKTVVGVAAAVAMAVPVGVLIARPVGGFPGFWQTAVFSFGLVAVLYLVTEGLLVEAHRRPEPAWATAMFFIGFLVLEVARKIMFVK